jgi:hypothetical protein
MRFISASMHPTTSAERHTWNFDMGDIVPKSFLSAHTFKAAPIFPLPLTFD